MLKWHTNAHHCMHFIWAVQFMSLYEMVKLIIRIGNYLKSEKVNV